MIRVMGSAGSTPAANTLVRRSRSVTRPARRGPSMTSSAETPCSAIVTAPSRIVAVSGTPTGARVASSAVRVFRIADPW